MLSISKGAFFCIGIDMLLCINTEPGRQGTRRPDIDSDDLFLQQTFIIDSGLTIFEVHKKQQRSPFIK